MLIILLGMFTFILWFVVRTSGLIEPRRARHILIQGWTVLIVLYFVAWMVTKPQPLPKTLLVPPFATQMSEPWIGEALSDQLGQHLAYSSFGVLQLPWDVCPQIKQGIPSDSMWMIIKKLQPTFAVWGMVRGQPDSLWVESDYARTKWGRTVRFSAHKRRYSSINEAANEIAELARNAALIRKREHGHEIVNVHPVPALRKYYLAKEQLASDNPRVALELARQAIAVDSSWSNAWALVGIAEGQIDDSSSDPMVAFHKAVLLDSTDLFAWQQLARFAILAHHWSLADSSLRKAYRLQRRNPVTLYLISHLRKDRAVSICNMTPQQAAELALAVHPGYLNARLMVAQNYYDIGDLGDCRTITRKGIDLYPNSWELWHMLSSLDIRQGKLQDALSEIKRSIKLSANNPDVLYNAGLVYFYLDSLRQAESFLQRSVRVKASSDAYYMLGQCAERQGDSTQATSYYRESVEAVSGKDDRSAQEAAKKIDNSVQR